jgi:hypothetical protein
MKKYSQLLLIAMFPFLQSFAQNSSNNFKRFGFKAGVNFTNMNFNRGVPPPAAPIQAAWKPGFATGFLLRVPLHATLLIQPEYLYSRIAGRDKSTGVNYKFDYLSMPVLLKYEPAAAKIAVEAGPQIDLLINANKDIGGISSNITHDTEERNLGIVAGLEFKVSKELRINARYMHGLNHVGIGQRSNVKEFKYEQLTISASAIF